MKMFKSEYQGKLYTEAMSNAEEDSAEKRHLRAIIDLGGKNEETLQGLFYDEDLDAAQEALKNGKFSAENLKPLKPVQLTTFLLYRFNVFDLQMGVALLIRQNTSKIADKFEDSQKIRKFLLEPEEGIFKEFPEGKDSCVSPCKKNKHIERHVSPFKRIKRIADAEIFKEISLKSRNDSANTFVDLRNSLAHPLFRDQKIGTNTEFEMSLFDIYKKDENITRRQKITNLVIENWNAVNDIKKYVINVIKRN